MFHEEEYITLKLRSMINEITLFLIGIFWVMSYTVFCYSYFGFRVIQLDSIITQISCIVIFLIILHHNRLISYYLRDMLDPHFSFSQESYNKILNRANSLIIIIPLVIVYGVITQRDIFVRLF